MALKVEFLGTAGALPIPRPFCACRVCADARERGVPYTRSGPSLFIHGPDVLVDTPGESVAQLNRSAVERIAACFYSHWHPDHTMGRHVFSAINADYRGWPPSPRAAIEVYLPEGVAADARRFLGFRDHLAFLEEQEGVIRVHELRDGERVEIGQTSVRPLPLAWKFAYAFLFEDGDRSLLVAPDELHGWTPPTEAYGVDLAVLPVGVLEMHPLTGARVVPEAHPVLGAKPTFEATLDLLATIAPRRVVLTHMEECDDLGYDDYLRVENRLRRRGLDVTFAYDTMTVDV